MSNTAIQVENLSKAYRLGIINHNMLYKDMQRWIARLLGKDDPNAPFQAKVDRKNDGELYDGERFWALRDISFEIGKGDIIGIIGRNGAGKSTLLKILSRITAPSTGVVRIRGRMSSLLEVSTGFHPELTGRENIYLNGAIFGMRKSEISKKFDEIVSFAEVDSFLDTPVKRYSSGMYVRLAFAVAAHLEPDILIVDEVLAVGDAQFQKKCLGKMKNVSTAEGRTVLFVSHNMSAISSLCSKGVLIEKGKISFYGDVQSAIDKYLMDASENSPEKMIWTSPKSEYPFSNIVKVSRYYVEDVEGIIPAGTLFNSRDYKVVVEADILCKEPDLVFLLSVYNDDNSILFVSDIHDDGDYNKEKLVPGKKKIIIPFPVHLLANKNYSIELSCAIYHKGWILLPDSGQRLKFSFVRDLDKGTRHNETHHPFTGGSRPGTIVPVLKWEIQTQ